MSKAPGITGDKWRPGDRVIDERWTKTFCDQVCSLPVRLADQAEYALLALVGLRQHSGGSLRENLRLRHSGGLRGEIDVFDPRTRFGQVGGLRRQVGDGDRKSTRLNSSHYCASSMPSSD